jgi:hypothetical protein
VLTFFPKGFVDAQQTRLLQAIGSDNAASGWMNADSAYDCDGQNASLFVNNNAAVERAVGSLTVSNFDASLTSLPNDAIVTNITVSFKATANGFDSQTELQASDVLLTVSGIPTPASESFPPSGPFSNSNLNLNLSFSLKPQLWGLPPNTNGSNFKAEAFALSFQFRAKKSTVTISLDCFFFEVIYFVPIISTAMVTPSPTSPQVTTPRPTPKPTPRPTPSPTPLPRGATFSPTPQPTPAPPTPQPSPLPPGATFPPTTSEIVIESTTESMTETQTPTTVFPVDSGPLSMAPAPVTDEGTPFWVWIIVAVVLIACIVAAGFAVVRWRQRNEAQEDPQPQSADETPTVSVVPKKSNATEVALKEKWLSLEGEANAKPSEGQLFSQLSQYASTSAVTQPVIYSSIRD